MEVKNKKYGSTIFYIDGNEIKDKKYGKTLYYVDDVEVKEGGVTER